MEELKGILPAVRAQKPLIHFITNYVTANDCANITLAAGASPVMADDIREVDQMVELCAALVINIGTLNERTAASMLAAGRRANLLNRPVIFDPVGTGASALRNDTVRLLMRELNFAVIKGNISEMKFLAGEVSATKGVDARELDLIMEANAAEGIAFARRLSALTGAVVAITGPVDIVADAQTAYVIRNGHPLMTAVTGTGCMGGALIGSYVGAAGPRALAAAALAVGAMGVCGEIAHERLGAGGSGSYRALLIDAVMQLDETAFFRRARLARKG